MQDSDNYKRGGLDDHYETEGCVAKVLLVVVIAGLIFMGLIYLLDKII